MTAKSLIATTVLSGLSVFLSACGQKKDPSEEAFNTLMQSVPADVTFFAGAYIPLEEQRELQAREDWKKVRAAIVGNPVLMQRFEGVFEADPELKAISEVLFGGKSGAEFVSDMLSAAPAPTAFVVYSDDFSEKDKAPDFAFAATMAESYVKVLADLLEQAKARNAAEKAWFKEVVGNKTIYTHTRDELSLVIALCGSDVLMAPSREALDRLEASFVNPPAKALKDSAIYQKSMKGSEGYNLVAFLNFDGIKNFRKTKKGDNAFAKSIKENAESIAFFADISSTGNTAHAFARMEFSKPTWCHEVLGQMGQTQMATLANALPGADYALGLGLPKFAGDWVKEAQIPDKAFNAFSRLGARNLYLSLSQLESVVGLIGGDISSVPQAFLKLECEDNTALTEDESVAALFAPNNPMAQKQNMNGVDVYSSFFFGIKYALLGKTGFYASNAFDASAALSLAQGNGKSLAQEGTYNALSERIAGANAFEVFSDDRAGIRTQVAFMEAQIKSIADAEKGPTYYAPEEDSEAPAESIADTEAGSVLEADLEALRSALAFQRLAADLMKKSVSGLALRRNGTAIELEWTCDYEYDFEAFAKALENLK